MKGIYFTLLIVFSLAGFASAQEQSEDMDYEIMLADVELRPGVTVDLNVKVFVNERRPCDGKTILAVTGAYQTADHYQALAEEMFEHNPTGRKICRLAALNWPGHGDSSLPDGDLLYGELTLADYVTSLLAALEQLPGHGVYPKTLIGHSMGGLVVQMVQQSLVDQGTNLRSAYHIKNVLLTGSVGPAAVPDTLAAMLSSLAGAYYMCYTGPGGTLQDPMCAMVDFDMDTDVDFVDLLLAWQGLRFDCDPDTTPLGPPPFNLPAPAAPNCDPGTILGDTHSNPDPVLYFVPESLTALLEVFGVLQYARPVVDAGIFGPHSRTRFSVVNFESDTFVPPSDGVLVYEYLTGDADHNRHYVVPGHNANHWMPFVDPKDMLEAIAGKICLP